MTGTASLCPPPKALHYQSGTGRGVSAHILIMHFFSSMISLLLALGTSAFAAVFFTRAYREQKRQEEGRYVSADPPLPSTPPYPVRPPLATRPDYPAYAPTVGNTDEAAA